ncbi:hypothetical protein GCM10018952_16640 [Streptosporangium vulgare]
MYDMSIIATPARPSLLTADDLFLVRQDESRGRAPMQNVTSGAYRGRDRIPALSYSLSRGCPRPATDVRRARRAVPGAERHPTRPAPP